MSQGSASVREKTRWTSGLTSTHWRILWGSFLGWIFDGYEALAPVFVMTPMLHSVLAPARAAQAGTFAGIVLGVTLIGWGIGGLLGGVFADYWGRKKVMLWSVLLYAVFSGATACASSFWTLCAWRFVTGLAMGSEWSTGVALVSETWPERARAKGVSFLQSGYGWGTFIASAAWYAISSTNPLGENNWRLMFLLGALPALFVLYLRRGVDESEKWLSAVRKQQWAAAAGSSEQASKPLKRPFPLKQVFASAESRRRILLSLLLSIVTSIGLWAVSSWLPSYATSLAQSEGLANASAWGAKVSIAFTVGTIVAFTIAGFVVDAIGRRPFMCLTFAGSLLMTIVSYRFVSSAQTMLWVAPIDGFFTLGCAYVWMAIYPAELFPSSARASAISFVFNGARMIAWVFPILAGSMIHSFGGISQAALCIGSVYVIGIVVPWFLPETLNQPLPD